MLRSTEGHELVTGIEEDIEQAARLVREADVLIVAAGAGMGVDSGLPDFRGTAGFWKAYPSLAQAKQSFMDVASPQTFRSDPSLAWGFYGHRLKLYRETRPHEGFATLRRWALSKGGEPLAFTSNVDGHFQKAGFAEALVEECHGSIHWLQCLEPCGRDVWSANDIEPEVDEQQCRWHGSLPRCPRCGGMLRPNILMFGDVDWIAHRYQDQNSRSSAWLASCKRPLVVEIGAGTHIPSVRYFTERLQEHHGASLIRINVREAAVTRDLDVGLPLSAMEAISRLDAKLN